MDDIERCSISFYHHREVSPSRGYRKWGGRLSSDGIGNKRVILGRMYNRGHAQEKVHHEICFEIVALSTEPIDWITDFLKRMKILSFIRMVVAK